MEVNITKRIDTPDGRRFCRVIFTPNGRIKPDWVEVDERQEKHPEGAYYLDWTEDGQRRRMAVGSDPTVAYNSLKKKQSELDAIARGLVVTDPVEEEENARLRLRAAIADFLEDTQLSRQRKTWLGYCLKREVIASFLIAQLWNGRVSDRIEIERRTEQFNRLAEAHNAEAERALSMKPQPTSGEEQADSELKRTVEGLDKRTAKVNAADRNSGENRPASIAVQAQSAGATTAGLQQRNMILERQAEAMRNTEANLRRRLNDTMAQLDQERNRNQTLKGA